ncbi:MAG: preprotein translocase subunit SecG [Nitrospirae bacterium]|nr:preprotein translocase subunit SecG [Nitrospirota bacterium]
MITFIIIIHIVVSFFLIAIVLLQGGKGAELGAAFGGSSQTLFGSRGAATFLSKLTTIAAILFMITSLTLAVVTAKKGSIVKETPVSKEGKSVPVAPGPFQSPTQSQIPKQPAQQPSTK